MTFHKPTQWQLTPKGTNLLGHSVIPPRYGQVKRHKVQAHVMKQKRIKCTYSNFLRIRVTHTMIPRLITSWSKTHCCFRTRPMGWMLLLLTQWRCRRRRMGPPGPGSSQYGSWYSMSGTCGPRDIMSLVIPRLGDNKHNLLSYP
jgi:hypothetical protein